MTCVDENAAIALLEGRLAVADADQLRAHALECESCRQLVAELAKASTSPRADIARHDSVPRRGDAIGRYIVLGYLGEGGMGVVYLGYDPDLDRRVALKFLHDGDRSWLLSEAQAIAKLSHPNVVSVFDVGHSGDALYVAMEYVPGVTLREWLAVERRSWAEIVERFRDAGRGLAAAHAAGIVHRDFKPDNVLVTDDRVRVLDFGLAAHANSAAPVGGTPRYMAPEQARGDEVSPAADQYSFCIALDEALRGQRIPARLANVIARGLASDPARRHATMEVLLAALMPRRRRAFIAVAGFAAIAAVAVSTFAARAPDDTCSGASDKLARVWNAPVKMAARASFMATGVPYASSAWQRAQDMLDHYGRDWTALHTDVCRASRRAEQSPRALDVRMGCLAQRLRDVDATANLFSHADTKIVEKSVQIAGGVPLVAGCADLDVSGAPFAPANPAVVASVDMLRGELARVRVLNESGNYAAAATLASATLERARATGYEPLRAEVLLRLGEAQAYAGAHEAAEQTLGDAYIAAETSGHGEMAASAAAQLIRVTGMFRGAHSQGLWWARIAHAVATRSSVAPATRALIASVHGDLLGMQARFDEALAQLDDALRTRLALFGPHHMLVASTRATIAKVRLRQGKFDEAIVALRDVLAIREAALPAMHPSLADTHDDLGNALASAGKLSDAIMALRRALEIREQSLGRNHPEVADSHLNIGSVLSAQGKSDEALIELRAARAIYEPLHHPALANVMLEIGIVLTTQARFDEAERTKRDALRMLEAQQGSDGPDVGRAHMSLANTLAQRGHDDEALLEYRRALVITTKRLGADHPAVAAVHTNMGGLLLHRRRNAEALGELEHALGVQDKQLGPDHPDTANTRAAIGVAHLGLRHYALAAASLRQALAALEHASPDDKATIDETKAALAKASARL
jgi:eukaryotic-like serine/threonine-protein kinase